MSTTVHGCWIWQELPCIYLIADHRSTCIKLTVAAQLQQQLLNLKSNSVMRLATATVETSSDYC
jgi:hypothetical protein